MDQISRVGIFIAVVEAQSFAGAARALGITSSAVSKQIQNLELDLQVKLLNRTTRNVSLTEEGTIYFERAARALGDLQEAKEQIYELRSRPRGPLKVSFPQSLGVQYFGGMITSFATKYPEVELDVRLDDRVVDIVKEKFDLALRIGSLKDASLIAKRLAPCPFVLCASTTYLDQRGVPQSPSDLVRHNVLSFTGNDGPHEWRYKDTEGQVRQIGLRGSFRSDSGEILRRTALEGLGIALLPVFYVAEFIENKSLQPILEDYETWPTRSIYAVFQPNHFQSTRLRLFVESLNSTCKQLPWVTGRTRG